jgi:hypothetical protein
LELNMPMGKKGFRFLVITFHLPPGSPFSISGSMQEISVQENILQATTAPWLQLLTTDISTAGAVTNSSLRAG